MSSKKLTQSLDYEVFTYWHAFFLVGAIVTYIVDMALDVVVSATYFYEGYFWYGSINLGLVLIPAVIVQIFSVRWYEMDSMMKKSYWYIHALLMGVVQRYLMVLKTGFEAKKSGHPVDYQRFYQSQSDVCMLRLFDSFAESAPQLVFHLYVMILKSHWPIEQAAWTGTSAIVSLISLGWGIAAYSSALRMTRDDKNKLTWAGMILQTFWRAGMICARLTALVMLALAIHHWIFIVMFVHWLLMTGWVIWQNTDFCATQWEERFYNAVVGIIYCFCFFNLKEGRSRQRAAIFYTVIVVENFTFVAVFFFVNGLKEDLEFSYWISVAAFLIVSIGTFMGLCGMLLYYRFFHPAGPIKPFVGESVDFSVDPDCKLSPDFVIHDASGISNETAKSSSSARRRQILPHSRSFKASCPPPRRRPRQDSVATSDVGPSLNASQNSRLGCPTMTSERIDSTYGTDSNRTVSPQDAKSEPAHNVSNTSSLSIAFNNDTYASVDVNTTTNNHIYNVNDKKENVNDVSYASVNPRTPKSRRTSVNETYMSVHQQQQEPPEVLLKRSPVVRDVTTALIASTHKLSLNETTNPLTTPHNDASKTESSVYKLVSSIPGAGKKLSQENKSTSTSSIDAKSGYKLLSTIPGAGKNVAKENKSTSCDVTSALPKSSRTSAGKAPAEKMTAPLTIIIPNISRAFARQSRSKSGEETPDLADKTISMEVLNPKSTFDHSNFSSHDYENLALININRSGLAKGLAHWRTYSDMADNKHDDSIACDQRHNNKDYSNYASLHYFDIYPLSKEIKEQLYRSLTPASTAATIATSDDCGFTNSNESDTYEPIEAFQDFFTAPKASGNPKSAPSDELVHDESKKQDSLNDTYGDLKVPVPVTLIHHDGKRLTTRQIVSMESLREVIRKHEKVPMDDPQDRGDLYLLAPMRLLLSPIAEEPEVNEAHPSHVTEAPGNDFNKSLMTVISELLSTTYSSKSFLHSTAVPNQHASNLQQFNPDGHCQDSVDSASSLVSIIDEIRNNSLCNLLYMTSSSADIKTTCDGETRPLPPSPVKVSEMQSNPGKGKSSIAENMPQAANTTTVVHNRDGSVRSVRSNIVTSSPVKKNGPPFPGNRKTPPLYSVVASKTGNAGMSPIKNQDGVNRKKSPLYTSVGSRKNLLELAGSSAESAILNTPKKIAAEKLSIAVPISKPSPHETRKLGYYQPFANPKQNANVEPKPIIDFVHTLNSADLQLRHSRIVRPKPVLTYPTSGIEYTETRPKPFISTAHNMSEFETSYRPTALTHFPALSPSAKYNSDNTPTPPLRENHFVRRVSNNNSKQPRRKFSIIREHFESPELRRRAGTDLYENISNNQLDPVTSSTRDKCQSVPTILADLELRADQKYDDQFGGNMESRSRSHWSTASFQKVPPALANRNVPNRRSMSIISDVSSTFQVPPRKPVYFDNKENEKPTEKAPAIPPRMASVRLAGNKSTLSPKSQIFSRLI